MIQSTWGPAGPPGRENTPVVGFKQFFKHLVGWKEGSNFKVNGTVMLVMMVLVLVSERLYAGLKQNLQSRLVEWKKRTERKDTVDETQTGDCSESPVTDSHNDVASKIAVPTVRPASSVSSSRSSHPHDGNDPSVSRDQRLQFLKIFNRHYQVVNKK